MQYHVADVIEDLDQVIPAVAALGIYELPAVDGGDSYIWWAVLVQADLRDRREPSSTKRRCPRARRHLRWASCAYWRCIVVDARRRDQRNLKHAASSRGDAR